MANNCGCHVPPVRNAFKTIADYQMPVGTTGFVFVAALPCTLLDHGVPVFEIDHMVKTMWSAAARLADMGLISGETFYFLRMAIPLDPAETVTLLNLAGGTGQIAAWESGAEPVPREMWMSLANRIRQLAQEGGNFFSSLTNPPDLRPRVIRIHSPVTGRPS